jgi:sugar/nucleoside kinase (ribokinase family)
VAPVYTDTVVSTLGAGDVFHGALLAQLVEDVPLAEALVAANVCAGLSCRALDGRSAIPTGEELEREVARFTASR